MWYNGFRLFSRPSLDKLGLPILEYLKNSKFEVSRKTKTQALNYVLLEDELYEWEGMMNSSLALPRSRWVHEVTLDMHNGAWVHIQSKSRCADWSVDLVSFVHQLLHDCINNDKVCKACQIYGSLQKVPRSKLIHLLNPSHSKDELYI